MARAYGSESIGFQAAVEHKPAICGVRSIIAFVQQSTFVQHGTITRTHSVTQTKKASSSLLDGITPRRPSICHIFGPDPRFSFLGPVRGSRHTNGVKRRETGGDGGGQDGRTTFSFHQSTWGGILVSSGRHALDVQVMPNVGARGRGRVFRARFWLIPVAWKPLRIQNARVVREGE
jgi:hypothetical protein